MIFNLDYSRQSDIDDSIGYWYVQQRGPEDCRVYYSCVTKLRTWVPGPVYSLLTKVASSRRRSGWAWSRSRSGRGSRSSAPAARSASSAAISPRACSRSSSRRRRCPKCRRPSSARSSAPKSGWIATRRAGAQGAARWRPAGSTSDGGGRGSRGCSGVGRGRRRHRGDGSVQAGSSAVARRRSVLACASAAQT